jgi:concanavalin A-like lectin/glucanase superfamily protein
MAIVAYWALVGCSTTVDDTAANGTSNDAAGADSRNDASADAVMGATANSAADATTVADEGILNDSTTADVLVPEANLDGATEGGSEKGNGSDGSADGPSEATLEGGTPADGVMDGPADGGGEASDSDGSSPGSLDSGLMDSSPMILDTSTANDSSTGCVAPPTGIVSWWTGDNTFADQQGLNAGAAVGTVTFAAGKVGDAFVLSGMDAVSAATNDFPTGSADRTIELWAYLSSTYGTYPSLTEMFAQYGTFGTTGAAFAIFTYGTSAITWSQWGSGCTGGAVTIGVWTHIAATSSAGTVTVYQNGGAVASIALSPYNTPSGTTFFIGGQGSDPQGKMDRLTGMVDEVTVYNRALSPAEIGSIYMAGSAGKCH